MTKYKMIYPGIHYYIRGERELYTASYINYGCTGLNSTTRVYGTRCKVWQAVVHYGHIYLKFKQRVVCKCNTYMGNALDVCCRSIRQLYDWIAGVDLDDGDGAIRVAYGLNHWASIYRVGLGTNLVWEWVYCIRNYGSSLYTFSY